MMKKNKLKKTLLILLLIVSFFLKYQKIYAGGGGSSGGGGGGSGGVFNPSGTPSYGSTCDWVSCSYSWYWEDSIDIVAEVKDMHGNIISRDALIEPISKEVLAGTYVMLRVYQKQDFYSQASYYVSAKRQVWTCEYWNYHEYPCCIEEYPSGACKTHGRCPKLELDSVTEEDCACGGSADSVVPIFKGWRDVTGEYVDSCAAGAVPRNDFEANQKVKAKYNDSNDIDEKQRPTTEIEIEGHDCDIPHTGTIPREAGEEYTSGANTLTGKCDVSYDRWSTICINVKNGNVRYLDNQINGECHKDEYKVLPDADGYWKYFIPLNANSFNDFSIELNTTGGKVIAETCNNIKENYPNTWQNIIKMNSDGTCIYDATITIPIIQRFYNELEDGKTFKGFNFYYKPIDINEPFPNGLTNTSIWYDWNKDKNKEPEISKSYNKITYYANTSGNEEKIRNYNNQKTKDIDKKDHPYASWDKMNVNGTSQFIKNEGIVASNVGIDSFYNLGCGPKNTNVKNIFAQPECDTK